MVTQCLNATADDTLTNSKQEPCSLEEDEVVLDVERDENGDYNDEKREDNDEKGEDKDEKGEDKDEKGEDNAGASGDSLCRLLLLAGHVAIYQLSYLEGAVVTEMKRQGEMSDCREPTPASNKKKSRRSNRKSQPSFMNSVIGENTEEELGLVGATAEDIESDVVRKVCEEQLVTDALHKLHWVSETLIQIVTNQGHYPDRQLQATASYSLAKLMLVSSRMCEQHLPLLITLLERGGDCVVKCNLLVALAEITFREPNLVEPWAPYIYTRLRDTDSTVRLTAVMVLSKLILNDMIRVKGHISEMARCVVDSDDQVKERCILFFRELAGKEVNAIYNVLPDIISHLSEGENLLSEEHFRTVMNFLLSLLDKEKQWENLVEKLCQRLHASCNDRVWHDVAHCLSIIPHTEKSLRRLLQNFPSFANKLVDEKVYISFTSLISSNRRGIKPEVKILLDELEDKMSVCNEKMKSGEEVVEGEDMLLEVGGGRTPATVKKGKRAGRRRKKGSDDDDSDDGRDGYSDDDKKNKTYRSPAHPASTKKLRSVNQARRKLNKPTISFSSDEEEVVEEEENRPPKPTPSRVGKCKKGPEAASSPLIQQNT